MNAVLKKLVTGKFPESQAGYIHQTGAEFTVGKGVAVTLYGRSTAKGIVPEVAEVVFDKGSDAVQVGLLVRGGKLVDFDGAFDLPAEVGALLLHMDVVLDDDDGNSRRAETICRRHGDFQWHVTPHRINGHAVIPEKQGCDVKIVSVADEDEMSDLAGQTGKVVCLDYEGLEHRFPHAPILIVGFPNGRQGKFWREEVQLVACAEVSANSTRAEAPGLDHDQDELTITP